MFHEIALFFGFVPEAVDTQRQDRGQERAEENAKQLAPFSVESEFPVAEIRVGGQKGVLFDLEERRIKPECQSAQDEALVIQPEEFPQLPAKREPYAAPGRAAQPVAARADDRKRDKYADDQIGQSRAYDLYRKARLEKLRQVAEREERQAENGHRL